MKPLDSLTDDEWLLFLRRAISLREPPEPLLRAVLALWQLEHCVVAPVPPAGLLRRVLVAALTFDNWATPPLATGMRALPSGVRHLVFTAEAHDIDLRIAPCAGRLPVAPGSLGTALLRPGGEPCWERPADSRSALAGQILGPGAADQVELQAQSDATLPRVSDVGEWGEFRFDDVPGGSYRLTVRLRHDEISLPPIDVGAPRGLGVSS